MPSTACRRQLLSRADRSKSQTTLHIYIGCSQTPFLPRGAVIRGGQGTRGCSYSGSRCTAVWSRAMGGKGSLSTVSHGHPAPPKMGGFLHLASAMTCPMQWMPWNSDLADPSTSRKSQPWGCSLSMLTHQAPFPALRSFQPTS